jgi:hypothetical protein
MKRNVPILILCALALLGAACSCQEIDPGKSAGSVTITLSTGAPESKAGDGVIADGGGIKSNGTRQPDLFIALVNYSGAVVATYQGVDTADSKCIESTETQASIRFDNFNATGEFKVYAVANTSGLWTLDNGATLAGASTEAALNSLIFAAMSGNPTVSEGGAMPLSATGTLFVNEGHNGEISLNLLRCVAKVGFRFKNESESRDFTLTACTVRLKAMNPTQGYVFPHTPDAAGTAGDLTLNMSGITLNRNSYTDFYGLNTVFPSEAPTQATGTRYLCDISFTVGDAEKSFSNLPVHDSRSRDITSLKRNQYLQITTRINEGLDISFDFEVAEWNPRTEEILFH